MRKRAAFLEALQWIANNNHAYLCVNIEIHGYSVQFLETYVAEFCEFNGETKMKCFTLIGKGIDAEEASEDYFHLLENQKVCFNRHQANEHVVDFNEEFQKYKEFKRSQKGG